MRKTVTPAAGLLAAALLGTAAGGALAQGAPPAERPVMDGIPPSPESQATFGNYREWPFSAWTFRNAGAVMNVRMVPRGEDVADLIAAPDDAIGRLTTTDARGEEKTVDAILAENFTDGFLVLRGRRILFERYYNGLDRHAQHMWFSATKSLTSTAAGILVDQGAIDVNASPADYVPELKGSGFERVTIQNVLDHSTSIDFKENYTDPDSDFLKYYGPALNMAWVPGARDVRPGETEIYGVHDFLSRFIRPDESQTAGEVFDYNSANSDVLGWIIARVSGMPYVDFVRETVWAKLGAEHDAYMTVDRALQGVATGGFNSTLRDAARFGAMILNRGEWNGRRIVSPEWVDATLALSAADKARMAANARYEGAPWIAYKNMWWVLDESRGEYMAVGIHGQAIYINRAAGVVIAMFSSQPQASTVGNDAFWSKFNAMRAIAASLGEG